MESIPVEQMAMRLMAAVVCGALMGLERERKNRPAGFRTMTLISLGSATFVLLGHEAIIGAGPSSSAVVGSAELSRVLQGLIGGVGFLGAGAVIQNKRAVRGLTTAAAVWVTAAMGAACGVGLYVLTGMVIVLALFTLVVLEWVERRWFPDPLDDDHGPRSGPPRGMAEGESDSEEDDDSSPKAPKSQST